MSNAQEKRVNRMDTQEGWGGAPAKANAFELYFNLTANQCPSFMMQLVQQAAANGFSFFYSDGGGALTISSTTSPTAAQIQSCSGNIALQFTL